MAIHTDKYKCKDDRFGCEYLYDICQTVSEYHMIFNERHEFITQYPEYNDYLPSEGGYTDEEWSVVLDFMEYLEDCEIIDMDFDERFMIEGVRDRYLYPHKYKHKL